jgi:hypothetical protein
MVEARLPQPLELTDQAVAVGMEVEELLVISPVLLPELFANMDVAVEVV